MDIDDVRAIDVLVTVALEVAAFIADCVDNVDDDEANDNDEVDGVDDDGALLENKKDKINVTSTFNLCSFLFYFYIFTLVHLRSN